MMNKYLIKTDDKKIIQFLKSRGVEVLKLKIGELTPIDVLEIVANYFDLPITYFNKDTKLVKSNRERSYKIYLYFYFAYKYTYPQFSTSAITKLINYDHTSIYAGTKSITNSMYLSEVETDVKNIKTILDAKLTKL